MTASATSVFVPFGDGAFRATLGAMTSPRALFDALRRCDGVHDVVVGERHVAVYVATTRMPTTALDAALAAALGARATASGAPAIAACEHRIRVRYDGVDLAEVAARAGRTCDDVVRLHADVVYAVERVGFLPGFAYLGEVDPRIATPRRATPRPRIDAMSVGIAGRRTGIYPFASPGGWRLLGTAIDVTLFDAERGATLSLGDRVVFEPV